MDMKKVQIEIKNVEKLERLTQEANYHAKELERVSHEIETFKPIVQIKS